MSSKTPPAAGIALAVPQMRDRLRAAWATYSSARAEQRTARALMAVMDATVQRRSREECLGLILARAVEALGALSGCTHLADSEQGEARLVYAVGVESLNVLARIPMEDEVCRGVAATGKSSVIETASNSRPWHALTHGGADAVVLTPLGQRRNLRGLLATGWPDADQAFASVPALMRIAHYAAQVIGEFDTLDQRAADFQALHAALRWQETMTRTAAHDLGNRLNVIAGLAGMVVQAGDEGEGKELLQEVVHQIEYAESVLDDLHAPDRPLALEAVPVAELAEVAACLMAQVGEAVNYASDVAPGLPAVWGERVALLRVIDNLLANAVRHNTNADGLTVWFRVTQPSPNELLFEVGDNGSGISQEQQVILLADDPHPDGRRGLGLWSSSRLVTAMGGRLWCESDPGHGARFFFALPAAAGDGAA